MAWRWRDKFRPDIKTLKEIGYDEMVSVELFRPEYWDWDIEETIKVAKEKTVNLVKRYFGH